jgi:hypothetical protein
MQNKEEIRKNPWIIDGDSKLYFKFYILVLYSAFYILPPERSGE